MRRLAAAFLCIIGVSVCLSVSAEGGESCLQINFQTPEQVDIGSLRTAWLGWINGLRTTNGLRPYEINEYLNATASNWSTFSVARGTINHRRSAKAAYYDYGAIEEWFERKGLSFSNVKGRTFTENIGWGPFRCPRGDCTKPLLEATRSTFEFFLSEKASNGVHYRSLVNPQFTQVGIGVALSQSQGRYYLTVHYGTEVTSDPAPLCSAS